MALLQSLTLSETRSNYFSANDLAVHNTFRRLAAALSYWS